MSLPLLNVHISTLEVVPKKITNEFRHILHLSYLKGSSVNDATDPKLYSVKYASFDSAVAMVAKLGKRALMWH